MTSSGSLARLIRSPDPGLMLSSSRRSVSERFRVNRQRVVERDFARIVDEQPGGRAKPQRPPQPGRSQPRQASRLERRLDAVDAE
jgi:hypothetical protein